MKRADADSDHPGISIAQASHIGRVRAANEDQVVVLEEKGLFVLTDGMGGHAGGGVASRVAIDEIVAGVLSGANLVEAVAQANRVVVETGRQSGAPDMGTTVVALRLKGCDFELAWVGDSRAYRFNGKPERLTVDHSVVRNMVASGEIGETEARDHPLRSMLTRALGSAGLKLSEIGTASGQWHPGDYLLLCSDGLHGVLDDEQMHGLIRGAGGVQSAVDALLQAALDRGGPDNVSMVLLGPQKTDDRIISGG